jgi:GT2 family glycosyltransferase
MTEGPLVSIQIVVFNGKKYIRRCLRSVRAQTYSNIEVVILDNASTDGTSEIIASEHPEFMLERGQTNLGMWPGQERLLNRSHGKYVLALSVDVILADDFIAKAVEHFESDSRLDAVQSKMYQYVVADDGDEPELERGIIDSCGFGMTRARKVINVGHGCADGPAFSQQQTIFGAEGAAPMFRRQALEDSMVEGRLVDHEYFWYGDDLDLAWRLTLFGHKQMYVPNVVAWHDRSTTKGAAAVPVIGQLKRLKARQQIPLKKRRLDWSNVRFTIIKNDYIINILRDLPYILAREIGIFGYTLIFEPKVFLEIGRFVRLLPRMLRRRQMVMIRAVLSPRQMHAFFV